MLAILFPHIDPIVFSVGPLAVRWYSLSYIAGVVLGYLFFVHMLKKSSYQISKAALDDIIIYIIVGIILGGRIGYVLFYDFANVLIDPIRIIKIWNGGMSFHGGALGVGFATYLLCKKYTLKTLPLLDLVSCVVPIGLFLGRIANFINGELYGRVTDVAWGVIFPTAGMLPRHPSQIYEALGEGLILFLLMQILFYFTQFKNRPGALLGFFLMGYTATRILIENFREPDAHIGFILLNTTLGQILSIPLFLIGIYLVLRKHNNS